jgi:hypothetical protein
MDYINYLKDVFKVHQVENGNAVRLLKWKQVEIIEKAQQAMQARQIMPNGTEAEAKNAVDGILNDFEGGIITKAEASQRFGEYTFALMETFWNQSKEKIKKNPELLADDCEI